MKTDTLDLRNCDCMKLMAEIEDKSQHIIVVDPPYFEVKGEFDFEWSSFEDYLKDVESWAKELQRILAGNGTLFWWGHAKKIAYSQIILDKYFTLCNSLVWKKTECQTRSQNFEDSRTFAPVTERLLMYSSNDMDMTGLQFIEKEFVAPRNPFAKKLKAARLQKGVSINQVAEYGKFYGKVNHGGSVTNWEKGYNIPSSEQWVKLCEFLPLGATEYDEIKREYNEIRKEYDSIRAEYEDQRRYFNNVSKFEDVLEFSQQGHITGKYNHPTQKSPIVCRAIIQTCSRRGQNCFIPFMGSGTEVVEAFNHGLNVSASELDPKWFEESIERVEKETRQLTFL